MRKYFMWRIQIYVKTTRLHWVFMRKIGATGAIERKYFRRTTDLAFKIMNMAVRWWRQLMHLLSKFFSHFQKLYMFCIYYCGGDIMELLEQKQQYHTTTSQKRMTEKISVLVKWGFHFKCGHIFCHFCLQDEETWIITEMWSDTIKSDGLLYSLLEVVYDDSYDNAMAMVDVFIPTKPIYIYIDVVQ